MTISSIHRPHLANVDNAAFSARPSASSVALTPAPASPSSLSLGDIATMVNLLIATLTQSDRKVQDKLRQSLEATASELCKKSADDLHKRADSLISKAVSAAATELGGFLTKVAQPLGESVSKEMQPLAETLGRSLAAACSKYLTELFQSPPAFQRA